MKAAAYRRYGPPDVVKIEEVKKPVPKDDEVLVKVRSASVNLVTGTECAGKPYIMRWGGLRKPKNPRLGCDVAGEVEAIGPEATKFKPGERRCSRHRSVRRIRVRSGVDLRAEARHPILRRSRLRAGSRVHCLTGPSRRVKTSAGPAC